MQRLRRQPELGPRNQKRTPKRHVLKGLLVTVASVVAFSASAPGTEAIVRFPTAQAQQAQDNGEKMKALFDALKNGNEKERINAVQELGMTGDAGAVPHLIEALLDKYAYVRKGAAEALGTLGDASAVRALTEVLEDENNYVRRAAIEALGTLGDLGAVSALTELLDDLAVRAYAATALGNIAEANPRKPQPLKAVPALIAMTKSALRDTCSAAVEALGKIAKANPKSPKLRKAIRPLIILLNDGDKTVQCKAAEALGNIKHDRAFFALVKALNKAMKSKDKAVGAAVVDALGNTKNPKAVHVLIKALGNEHLSANAVDALARIGEPAVRPLIKAVKSKDEQVRRNAVEALGKIGDPEAVDVLIKALKDSDYAVRCGAAIALGEIQDDDAVPALIEALRDAWACGYAAAALAKIGLDDGQFGLVLEMLKSDVPQERYGASRALEKIGKPAVPALIEALKSTKKEVRNTAISTLEKIGDKSALEALQRVAESDLDESVREAAKKAAETLSK